MGIRYASGRWDSLKTHLI